MLEYFNNGKTFNCKILKHDITGLYSRRTYSCFTAPSREEGTGKKKGKKKGNKGDQGKRKVRIVYFGNKHQTITENNSI